MLTILINWPTHSTLVVLERSLTLNALGMHISLVNLASEALVGGEAHSEVADLNVE